MMVQRILLALCLCFAATLYAQNTPEELLAAALNSYHTLQADFNEKTSATTGEVIETNHGDIAFQRPDLFRWYSMTPSRQLIISTDQKLAIYDVDLAQVTYKKGDEQYGATPALLLSGNVAQLKQHYWIKTCPDTAANCYQLLAKDDNDVFKQLSITFRKGILKTMVIDNNLDQTTEIEFSNVKINATLDPNLFKLALPSDVDVVQ